MSDSSNIGPTLWAITLTVAVDHGRIDDEFDEHLTVLNQALTSARG